MTSRRRPKTDRVAALGFFATLKWLDGSPLAATIEPYRRAIFAAALDDVGPTGRPRYNLILCGRAKKNWKTADLVLASLYALLGNDSPSGNQCYILANDRDQAGDDLVLAKKLVEANPSTLGERLTVRRDVLERVDARGFLEILPAGDVVGSHGKTYRMAAFDEIHGYKTWDIFEAMQLDPTRADSQQWITSYASIYHRPGVPLFDLTANGKKRSDPRMLFSWYAADYTTDPAFQDREPEARANPSMTGPTWDAGYLQQQRTRLPAHKFRRLHLNLPGLPEGSAYSAEVIMDAVDRGVRERLPEPAVKYVAFVDMSGGSNDDAVLAVAHKDADGRAVLDAVVNQGPPCPFDPNEAVPRFVDVMRRYRVGTVRGDSYAGETFKRSFEKLGVDFVTSDLTKSELYEAAEPALNAGNVVLLDSPTTEQELLGLVWRGSKIDHPPGEHDDHANAVAGAVHLALVAEPGGFVVAVATKAWHHVGGPTERSASGQTVPAGGDQSAVHPHERAGRSPFDRLALSERKRRAWGGA